MVLDGKGDDAWGEVRGMTGAGERTRGGWFWGLFHFVQTLHSQLRKGDKKKMLRNN